MCIRKSNVVDILDVALVLVSEGVGSFIMCSENRTIKIILELDTQLIRNYRLLHIKEIALCRSRAVGLSQFLYYQQPSSPLTHAYSP